MTNAAKSIVAWGVYALSAGAALLFQPDYTLQILGFEATEEHWVLVVALLLMGFGFYYVVLGITEVKQFFIISAVGRTVFFIASASLILLGKAPVSMLIFGVIDLITAAWTVVAMFFDKKTSHTAGKH